MLTLNPGDIFAENYRLIRLIDTGGFSEVWEAEFLSAGNTVALKIYPKLDAEGVKNIEAEYKNQSDLSHSNLLIARYFGKYNGYPYLEMRYCGGGNASGEIGNMTEPQIAKCIFQIASALEYLHSNNIVHQDVKPNNFLLDNTGNYNLADLGLSLKVRATIMKFTQAKTTHSNSIAGLTPPAYRAPELYDRSSIGAQPVKATDIWALGASIFELASGDVPFGEFGGLMQMKNPDVPDLPSQYSKQLNEIVKKCLSKETWDRPKASQLAAWAYNYQANGNYGTLEPLPPKTIDPPIKTIAEPVKNKTSKKPVLLILIALILVAGAAWGVKTFIGKDNPKPFGAGDTLVVNKPVLPAPDTSSKLSEKLPKPDTTTNGSEKNDAKVKTPSTETTLVVKEKNKDSLALRKKEIAEEDKTAALSKSKLYQFSVESPPASKTISISKIEKTQNNLKVYFRLRSENDAATFTIYGPEYHNYCFFINVAGHEYNLVDIYPKGAGLHFTPGKDFTFTATFQKIPDNATVIDIIEGRDRDWKDQNYWTFKKIHLK